MKKALKSGVGRIRDICSTLCRHKVWRGLTPTALRCILEELGPLYIKLGQIMSMRTDVLPEAYCHELKLLHSDVSPMPADEVLHIISEEYGRPWNEVFSSFDPCVLGAASIAQVHAAVLPTGERVAVKVQRPESLSLVERDITLIRAVAKLLRHTTAGTVVNLDMILREIWEAAQIEMDFLTEADNLEAFTRLNAGRPLIQCPLVYRELTTRHVLVMEYIDGVHIDDRRRLLSEGCDCRALAGRLAADYARSILRDRFFHADPHSGNIFLRDGALVWIDFGMVGIISKRFSELYIKGVKAAVLCDCDAIADILLEMSGRDFSCDKSLLCVAINSVILEARAKPLAELDLSRMLNSFLSVLRKNNITMPEGVTMLTKSIVTMEGTLRALDPDIDMFFILGHILSVVGDEGSVQKKKTEA